MNPSTCSAVNVAALLDNSSENGPGDRCVLWVQGCYLRCPGCCNPEFQSFHTERTLMTPQEMADWVVGCVEAGVRGLSLSGGEPLAALHITGILDAIRIAKEKVNFDVLAFTGLDPRMAAGYVDWFSNGEPIIDLLIAGRYDQHLKHEAGIVASTNQEIIRLTDAFKDIPDDWFYSRERSLEVILDEEGLAHFTGFFSPEQLAAIIS